MSNICANYWLLKPKKTQMTKTTTLVAIIVVKHLHKLLVIETIKNADDKDYYPACNNCCHASENSTNYW